MRIQPITVGLGVVATIFTARKHLVRIVDPDRPDPARYFWIGKLTLLAVLMAMTWLSLSAAAPESTIVLIVVFVLAVPVLYFCGSMYLDYRAAIRRRNTGYAISEHSYRYAPRSIKVSMRKIYSAASSITSGHAHRDGMFGDIDLSRLVYSAACRAVLASELRDSTTGLIRTAGLAAAVEQTQLSQSRMQVLVSEIQAVEKSLTRAKKSAAALSTELKAPARRAAVRQADEERQQQNQSALRRIDEINARIDADATSDSRDVEDLVVSVHAAFVEATTAATKVGDLTAPSSSNSHGRSSDARRGLPGTAKTAVRTAAAGAGKARHVAGRARGRVAGWLSSVRSRASSRGPADSL